jgi:5-methyltetrahydrofolate--homocysteine methyltransferase
MKAFGMSDLQAIATGVERGKNLEVPEAVKTDLDNGIAPYDVLTDGLQAGLLAVGERFKKNQCFIPELLLSPGP